MTAARFGFDRFVLDEADRRLTFDGAPVALNGRYLDALALLVREEGRLVSKDRFMDEVWRGAPVTDEALTQCIRTLRRRLGDEAARPRFIETAPKHGYRFIAPVERLEAGVAAAGREARATPEAGASPAVSLGLALRLAGAAAAGGGAAGVLGGVFYSLIGAAPSGGIGALSVLLVLVGLTVLVGVVGGAGVGFGIAAAGLSFGRLGRGVVLGGALGGLLTGALVKLLGIDAFNLLFGRSPGEITGALEGALLGGAVGFGVWLGGTNARRAALAAGLAAGAAGAAIPLLGGRLMAGSLDLLADRFPASRLRLGQIGGLFGEAGLGPLSQMAIAGFEGLMFGACVAAAVAWTRRR